MKKKIAFITSGWSVDYVLSAINGMQRACSNSNADLYIFSAYKYAEPDGTQNRTGFAIFDIINYEDFDGVIFTPNLLNDDEKANAIAAKIIEAKIPAITISQSIRDLPLIQSINQAPYRELIDHLIDKHNCKNFAFIGGPKDNLGANANFDAFCQSLKNHNIEVNPDNLYMNGDWSMEFAYKATDSILSKEELPDAVVCINDTAAMSFIERASLKGIRIPDDIRVIGFDDVFFASKLTPSITTLNLNSDKIGELAVNYVLGNCSPDTKLEITAEQHLRQSCGCQKKVTIEQIIFSHGTAHKMDETQRFTSQLRHLEDVFIKHETIDGLSMNLQSYFEKRHYFEGPDFAILLKEDVVENLNNEKSLDSSSYKYGKRMNIIANIHNEKSSSRGIIHTKDLIPENMKDEAPATYCFLPIFNQKFLHGYYVSKNNLNLIEEKRAYNWTRNFGAIIEKFRQTSIYRNMSEQLREISTRDALSGLLNRQGLDTFANDLFISNNNNQMDTEIVFVDINNMKIINDKHGHLHGDLAIKTVAETIRSEIPKDYLAIRFGGDEFVIIGPAASKNDFFTKIKEKLEEKSKRMSLPYKLTVSMGGKIFKPREKTYLLDAITEADKIMYVEKEAFHKAEKLN